MLAVVLCLVIALPAFAVLANGKGDARAAYDRGVAAFGKGDVRTARIELLNAVKADPQWAQARLMQARALLAMGDGLGAEAEISRARDLGTAVPLTRHMMARALLLQGRTDDALKEALSDDVDARFAAEAQRMAGRAYQAQGRMDLATQAFGKMLRLAPDNSRSWTDIARFRLALGDQGGAVIAADRAVRADPRNVDAIIFRGMLVRDQYGPLAAIPWFQKALALDSNNVPALTEYAATLAELGQARRMLAVTRRIIALDPGNFRAFFMQAVMAARAGNYDLARGLMQRTGGKMDDMPAAMLLAGGLHYQAGNFTLAAERFDRLLTRQPFNMKARQLLGAAQYRAGDFTAAVRTLQPLSERKDADSYSLTLSARAYEALGERGTAERLFERAALPVRGDAEVFAGAGNPVLLASAAMEHPDSAAAVIPYVRALLEAGETDQAIARAGSLQQANRNAPDAHVVYGDALSAAGRYAQAAEAYGQAANLAFTEATALRMVAAYRHAGDTAAAVRVLNLYLGQNPLSVPANRLAATVHLEAGNWAQAAFLLERLRRRIGNGDALLLTDLAWARLGEGQTRIALALAHHAYALLPSSPVTSDAYGWMRYKADGASRTSIDLLEKAVALSPKNPLLNQHLNEVYAKVGTKGL
ncbi:tetratricopeptide repeat protein [Rhizorhapis sp. SPR117]|uniref:tetratricopeptide repeat protein n=1 Tax=Rhizorhapis sp. SPR117 TaxID=2912611 RepID=UPI001F182572